MKAPLPSIENEIASHNAHTMRFTIVTYTSRLHLADYPWQPEQDSPAARRALDPRNGRKFHWNGSQCGVVRGPNGDTLGDRLVTGAKFNALPTNERCKNCNAQFCAA